VLIIFDYQTFSMYKKIDLFRRPIFVVNFFNSIHNKNRPSKKEEPEIKIKFCINALHKNQLIFLKIKNRYSVSTSHCSLNFLSYLFNITKTGFSKEIPEAKK